MEVGARFDQYDVLVLMEDGSSKVYARVKDPSDQWLLKLKSLAQKTYRAWQCFGWSGMSLSGPFLSEPPR